MLTAGKLAVDPTNGYREAGAGALFKAGAAIFDDDAVAVERSADGVPPNLNAMGADIGVMHSASEAGTDVQVVDVHRVVWGVGVGGAEGDVAACATIAVEGDLFVLPTARCGAIDGVDGGETGGIFGVFHDTYLDLA